MFKAQVPEAQVSVIPLIAALVLAASSDGGAPPAAAELPLVTRSRTLMSTRVTIAIESDAGESLEPAFTAAFKEFERVERVMNEWDETSPLARINRAAGSRTEVEASADLCAVVELSLKAAERTGGLFDPTWAGLRELWRFGTAPGERVPPTDAQLKAACPRVNHRDVQLRWLKGGGACKVRLKRAGMKLGLGGVAKGWAVDRAVAALRALRLQNFLVQAGGDLYAAGRRSGRPWQVGVRDPRGAPESYFARVLVSDSAFSTSGDYERFFLHDGVRYHHLIDPRTCRPATASRSATVLAWTAVEAELLTKASFIAGGEAGLALVREAGAEVLLVTSENQVLATAGLRAQAELQTPSDGL